MSRLFLQILSFFRAVFFDALKIARELFKILIPLVVIVKIASSVGAIELLGRLLAPVMSLVGLPGELGIVWAAAILTNIYGGFATFMTIMPNHSLSVAEMTVLCSMILICHSLPVELSLTAKVGGSARFAGVLRLVAAFIYGALLYRLYALFSLFPDKAEVNWIKQRAETGLPDWLLNQASNLCFTFVVLFSLLALMRLLDKLGVTRALARMLAPMLRLIGASRRAAAIAVFGLLAGITFGSGLILGEARKNELSKRDIGIVMAFLSLCHGIIEDTSLMLLMGSDLSGVLFGRIIFSVLAMIILSRLPFFAASEEEPENSTDSVTRLGKAA